MIISNKFPSYDRGSSPLNVYRISDGIKPSIHRFYDTSPISPSGQFIAFTEFPYQDRLPKPGDNARVVVLELASANEIYSASTAAWDTQVGAHVQWGANDEELYFNRMHLENWTPFAVKVNIFDRTEDRLDNTVYMVSPDGARAITPCLRRIGLAQPGYGVITPPESITPNEGVSSQDGLYSVDTATGRSHRIISFAELFDRAGRDATHVGAGAYYGFHAKWNPAGDRVMFIVRFLPQSSKVGKTRNYLFTLSPDGTDVALALSPEQWEGGHHPNWCPDGESIVMNLIHPRPPEWRTKESKLRSRVSRKLGVHTFPKARRLSLVRIDHLGRSIQCMAPSSIGSGHPSVDPTGRLLVTDAYPSEEVAFNDGTVPIRGIDLQTGAESCLARIDTRPTFSGKNNEYRIDPHPAWDRSGKFLVFNGSVDGCRSVFMADVSNFLDSLPAAW